MNLRIGIIGDFQPAFASHHATNAAIDHAAADLGIAAQGRWIATPEFVTLHPEALMREVDALWASPGSPYVSFEGMLRGIRIARERAIPFLGT